MARLIYASNMSLDGWTEDDQGRFDWAPPDDEVFAFTKSLMWSVGTHLYGRRMYETMAVWETDAALAGRDGHGITDGSRGGGITSQISPGGSRCGGRRLRRSD